jgi:hypothetical protein
MNNLIKVGYSIENISNLTDSYRYFRINTTKSNGISGEIIAKKEDDNNNSFIKMQYQKNFPESRLGPEKAYLKEETNKIAQSCNITLHWYFAEWSFGYQ